MTSRALWYAHVMHGPHGSSHPRHNSGPSSPALIPRALHQLRPHPADWERPRRQGRVRPSPWLPHDRPCRRVSVLVTNRSRASFAAHSRPRGECREGRRRPHDFRKCGSHLPFQQQQQIDFVCTSEDTQLDLSTYSIREMRKAGLSYYTIRSDQHPLVGCNHYVNRGPFQKKIQSLKVHARRLRRCHRAACHPEGLPRARQPAPCPCPAA